MQNTSELNISTSKWIHYLKKGFIKLGVLPAFLLISIGYFSFASENFLTLQNISNVLRQSVYIVLVSLGQMLVLITGGFDLSVGTAIALTSVISALTMISAMSFGIESIVLIIAFGCLAGLLSGIVIGLINGIGVARLDVSPFIMTLGIQSVGFGAALYLTGGVPVTGMPYEFGNIFGYGKVFNIPFPIFVAIICSISMWLLMNKTKYGSYFYAIGGNIKAARLSGINTQLFLTLAYVICALLSAIAGLLLTARVESGEANLGGSIALESITACVIAGVSLRGGIGRVENVILGAIFIVMVQNGMNLVQIGSYMQMILLGIILIIAVIFDQYRYRMLKEVQY